MHEWSRRTAVAVTDPCAVKVGIIRLYQTLRIVHLSRSHNHLLQLTQSFNKQKNQPSAMANQEVRTLKAACLCGNAKHEMKVSTSALPLQATMCHCTSCRHMTGLLCLTAAPLPSEYKPSESLLERLQGYEVMENLLYYHCPHCGTKMLAQYLDNWSTFLGVLEEGDPSVYEIATHIFVDETIDGGFSNFLPEVHGKQIQRFAKYTDSETLPSHWTAPSRKMPETSPNDRLHGYCRCRGVEFWISRPSTRSSWAKEAYHGNAWPKGRYAPESETFWLRQNGKKFRAAVCPCDSCRLAANGNSFAQWAYIPTVDVSLDAEGKIPMPESLTWGTLKSCRTSERASQHFCGTCGAVVFWNTDARPYLKDFGVGLFDAEDGARAESWFHWRTKDLRHREDGLRRAASLTLGVEKGLKEYAENRAS